MIYMDNSATTSIKKEVFDEMVPYLTNEYGNPSSKYYPLALSAYEAVEKSRFNVAKLIGAKPEEILFTSGSTESNNMIIKGVSDYQNLYLNKGNHIITSKAEHHSVLNVCKFLNGDIYSNDDASFAFGGGSRKVDRGYIVDFLDVNSKGAVENNTFLSHITPTTVLASFIWGNNEIGTLNDIKALATIAHNNDVLIHTDATQVVGKMKINVKEIDVDFLSLSGHKFHAPKGVGAVYIKSDDYGIPPFSVFLHGGEQEHGYRAGTLAVHNIVGLGKAAQLAKEQLDLYAEKWKKKDAEILEYLLTVQSIEVLGDLENRLPGVYSIVIKDPMFNNELFIKDMRENFALSTGSACSLGKPSHVLEAIGRVSDIGKVLRISIDLDINQKDIFKNIKKLMCSL